ncbi:MAG: histone-like nucleoid-structuring protein Lsr2 [Nakamurella sp.]
MRIRQWAATQGMTVSAKGRVPTTVVAAYTRAHATS